jgi:phenylalanyl-tRNA synthetase alpha chain
MNKENKQGVLHPITQTIRTVTDIFVRMGFEVANGPHIEDQWHNFDALNVPQDHPARDMQDTFFVRPEKGVQEERPKVLRTHTSSVQIRFLESFIKNNRSFPCKVISPGMVFRQEATDRTHETQFYQLEGLVVGTDVSMAHLKGTLETFLKEFYQQDVAFRFRPGYFPFVEPGIEIDLQFNDTWLEVLGAGMVHPQVLENVGIDATKYQGFAFGVGIDRLTMMKYGITDIRTLYQGDLRLHDSLSPTN